MNLIFSIHAQCNGNRFATGGGDHCVKVWSLVAALDVQKEQQDASSSPKLLATLTDHNGPVNVVRFSPVSSMLASGSDDGTACVYELQNGPGGAVLGGETNVENWRTKFLLKGHGSNIVDVSWSPDGAYLATASIDNTVMVWDVGTGTSVQTITHHHSFVKGVAWDPVGTYLATQSEDESVAVWKRDDWSLAGEITSPFRSMVTTTFSMRLSWSPDGQYLMAGNSYQGSTHVAVAVPREKWDKKDEYLLICGHRGVVVAPCFSPRMYHVPPLGEKDGVPSESVTSVFALGAQDGKVSVWAASAERAYFVGKRFFESQVLDVAWTPDGMALLACSADKTVGCFQFEENELGPVATKEEMDAVMKALYGSTSGRQIKRNLIESAEQLALEKTAAAVAAVAPVKRTLDALDARISGAPSSSAAAVGAVTQTGFGPLSPSKMEQQQRQGQVLPPLKKRAVDVDVVDGDRGEMEQYNVTTTSDGVDRACNYSTYDGIYLPSIPVLESISSSWQTSGALRELHALMSRNFADGVQSMKENQAVLVAKNKSIKVGGCDYCQIKVSYPNGSWNDLVQGDVVAAAGSKRFCVVATADGHLLMYTPGGRRKSAPICIGSGISNLTVSPSNSDLMMTVSTSGVMRVYNVVEMKQVFETRLASILEGKREVIDVALSKSGSPLVTMSDSSAYVWHSGLNSWSKVMDSSMRISNFYPLSHMMSGQGEVNGLQSRARKDDSSHSHVLFGSGSSANLARYHVSRTHIEGNISTAVALGSRGELESFLKSYCHLLVESHDESRLTELSDDLIRGIVSGDVEFDHSMIKAVLIPSMVMERSLSKLVQRCQDMMNDLEQE